MEIIDIYKKEKLKEEMQQFFLSEGFIQLTDFLKGDIVNIKSKILKSNFNQVYNPMIMRKKDLLEKEIFDVDILKFLEFFKSKEFREYIENITGFELELKDFNLNMYENKDYALLHDSLKTKEDYIEVIYDMSDFIAEGAGGVLTYTTKEEEVFYLEPTFNSLTIIFKPEDIMKYLKYINNKAKDKKILRVEMRFELSEE